MMWRYVVIAFTVGLSGLNFESENSVSSSTVIDKNRQKTDSVILWSSSKKLTWNDFNGKAVPQSLYEAVTFSTVEVNVVKSDSDSIVYNVFCYFEKNLSWSKDRESEDLLKHEQIHFDITELVTRRMRKKLMNIQFVDIKSAKNEVKKIFFEEEAERLEINKSYDYATDHGKILDEQKDWELKIARELKALDAYSSTRVTIKKSK